MLEWLTPDPSRPQRDDVPPVQTHELPRLISQAEAEAAEEQQGLENHRTPEP
tara:strand:- start:137 stop:292 length:156 start_codon:yes stop_codon:yes gene_type:complete